MGGSESPSGPRRADARCNNARIRAAAAEAVAEVGVEVQMSEVARRAGVAIGTVYRHFPTKEALIDALLLDQLTDAAHASRDAAAAQSDPWQALEAFLRTITASQVADRSLSHYIGGRVPASAELRAAVGEVFESFTDLVAAAHASGQLRSDVEATDIRMAMICVSRAIWADWPSPDWILDRYLRLVLDGLHAPGHQQLGGAAPVTRDFESGPDHEQVAAFRRGRRRWRR